MESFFSRYRNLVVLTLALLVQVLGLALQVRKADAGVSATAQANVTSHDAKPVRLIRLWAASAVTPFERAIHWGTQGAADVWAGYLDLRHTREQNAELQKTIDRLRLEQATLLEDARQGQRLQWLLKFRESYIYQTVPAQVIGSSGSIQSRVVWLDKGKDAGLQPDMAVITPDGIVGKVRTVFDRTAQVLLINDETSGAGVVLETTRVRGILRGNASGQPQVVNLLADNRIQAGEKVLTAGGDQIFPRGLAVGTVEKVIRDTERGSYIDVVLKPAANLDHLDEVLVITQLGEQLSPEQQADVDASEALKGGEVAAAEAERKRAAAEMEERLPSLADPNAPKPAEGSAKPGDAPVAPPVPKPLPAKHADRFTPSGGSQSDAVTERPDAPKAVVATPAKTAGATKAVVPASKAVAGGKPGAKTKPGGVK